MKLNKIITNKMEIFSTYTQRNNVEMTMADKLQSVALSLT